MIDFYKYIYKISNKNKFWFFIIIIFFVIILRKRNIRLSHILGLSIGITICIYLNSYNLNMKSSNLEIYQEKKKNIEFNYQDKYANIINFIFKLKDLRKIDDRNYDLFILSVRKFIQLDKDFEYLLESEANKTWLTQNIIKMNDYKNKSLDYLLSITISESNEKVDEKVGESIDKLDKILGCYINNNKQEANLYDNQEYKLLDMVELNIKPFNYTI
jgi:hypothetical protein